MKIKFLKAGGGDAILIHHKNRNILIDGGNESTFLLKELNSIIGNGECIDLLVITHHDDDHIAGVIEILEHVKSGKYGDNKDIIKRVLFNSPKLILEQTRQTDDSLLSYRQAHIVENLLAEINTDWSNIITNESDPINFDDMKLTFLSPDKNSLEKYSEDKGVLLSRESKCDWNIPMSKLEKWIDDASQDNSKSNRSSIVILLECNDKKILLTGDVTPDRFTKVIQEMYNKNNNQPVPFDYIKLPHHGSYRNLNKKVLSQINCFNYIITTDGSNSSLPDKRALLKIVLYLKNENRKCIKFFFNYKDTIDNLKITPRELKKYNISLMSNNNENGYNI